MNVKIKSSQIYEDFEDKNEEIYENIILNFIDKNIYIKYNDNEIILNKEEKTVEIKRSENNIFIELNKENESTYITPYGNIPLKIVGEEIIFKENPLNIILKYKIKLGNMTEYKNIIEIIEL